MSEFKTNVIKSSTFLAVLQRLKSAADIMKQLVSCCRQSFLSLLKMMADVICKLMEILRTNAK